MLSVTTDEMMRRLGCLVGTRLRGGEVIELVGDVGAGKTTFVKGIGEGLQVDDDVQSPSFTISRVYSCRDGLELHHYDLYRLSVAGVMEYELAESLQQPHAVTVIEWAETVHNVLPEQRLVITINYQPQDEGRQVTMQLPNGFEYLSVLQGDIA